MPAARLYGSESRLPAGEQWGAVEIQRVWRPSLKQASNIGRIINALTMLLAWTWRAMVTRPAAQEIVVIGTDPILSVLVLFPGDCFDRVVVLCTGATMSIPKRHCGRIAQTGLAAGPFC